MRKPLLAIIAMATAITMAQAQADTTADRDTNPLFATTGPNTVGPGHLQLGLTAGGLWQRSTSDISGTASAATNYSSNILGGAATLRYGLGEHIELSAGLGASSASVHYASTLNAATPAIDTTTATLGLGVGFRTKLLQSRAWWMPTVTLGLGGFMPVALGADSARTAHVLGAGLQMRNRLSERWAVDYSIGFSFGSQQQQRYTGLHYSVAARYLATESLLLGVGLSDGTALLEARWQATPALQLTAQGGVSGGLGVLSGAGNIKATATLGVSWMIR